MNNQEIIDYVMKTPHNTNPAILKQMIDENSGGSGGSQSGEMVADGADIYIIMEGMKMKFIEMQAMVMSGNIKYSPIPESLYVTVVREEPPFIGRMLNDLDPLPEHLLVTNNGEIYFRNSSSWKRVQEEMGIPEHGWIEKEKFETLDPSNEENIGFYAVRTVRYPMMDGSLIDFTSNLEVISTAFEGHYLLNTVNIPNARIIGKSAFLNCKGLLSVDIPKVEAIGDIAFMNCNNLESIVLPNSLLGIGEYAFRNCIELKNITFNGTVAQWNTILLRKGWNSGVPATEVVCSDGVVSLV